VTALRLTRAGRAHERAFVTAGPDEDGFYFSDGVGLAMRRLAIIDLKAASSRFPILTAPPGSFSIGEIYNYVSCAGSGRARARVPH